MYNSFHHFGGIVVAPGYTDPLKLNDGNPYGTSHVSALGALPVGDIAHQAAVYQGAKVTKITKSSQVRPELTRWSHPAPTWDQIVCPDCNRHPPPFKR